MYCVDQEDGLQPLSTKLLRLIKWIPDGETAERKLKIAEAISPKWRDVAMLVGVSDAQITSIQNPGSGKTPEQCLYDILRIWQESSGVGGSNEYPYSWDGLLGLLNDIEYGVLADDLREALSSEKSTVSGNLHQKERDEGTVGVVSCLSVTYKRQCFAQS